MSDSPPTGNKPAILNIAQELCQPIALEKLPPNIGCPTIHGCVEQAVKQITAGFEHLDSHFDGQIQAITSELTNNPKNAGQAAEQLQKLAELRQKIEKETKDAAPWLKAAGHLAEAIGMLASGEGTINNHHLDAISRPRQILDKTLDAARDVTTALTQAGAAGDLTVMLSSALPLLSVAHDSFFMESRSSVPLTLMARQRMHEQETAQSKPSPQIAGKPGAWMERMIVEGVVKGKLPPHS